MPGRSIAFAASGWLLTAVVPDAALAAGDTHPERTFYDLKYPPASRDARFPVDVWDFSDPELAALPVVGGALALGGARGALTAVPGGTRLPANTYFIADHSLSPDVVSVRGAYTLVFDVSVPQLGQWVPLYNTQVRNDNRAEAYVSPDGRIGQSTYSSPVILAGRWYRITVVMDPVAERQRFYVDGARVLEVDAKGQGGRFTLGTAPIFPAQLLLFATDDDTPAVDLSRAALFDHALSDPEVAALGDFDGDITPVRPREHRFEIRVDYSLDDSGFFKDPAARAALEGAVKLWGDIITSDFPSPAGAHDSVWHVGREEYVPVTLPADAGDYVLYAMGHDYQGGTKATASVAGSAKRDKRDPWGYRYWGRRYRPWVGRIVIDTTPDRPWFFDATPYTSDDVPADTHYDFIATAVHEIGHALGFVAGELEYLGLSDGATRFLGPVSVRRNGQEPPILARGQGHWSVDFLTGIARPNVEVHGMAGFDRLAGYRTYPDAQDAAALRDIGYEIDFSGVFVDPFFGPKTHPDAAAYLRRHPGGERPAGLWHLTSDALASSSAIVGFPLKYRAATTDRARGTVAKLVDIGGAVRVPKGSGFVATYDLGPSQGGAYINEYTLVFDVRLDALGSWHPLYNTSTRNAGQADAWIDRKGQLGSSTSSSVALTPGQWHRVVVAVDNRDRTQTYYLDGQRAVTSATSGVDGSASLGVLPKDNQWVRLLSDGQGNDADIDVRKIALFGRALTADEVRRLGDASGDIAL